MHNNFKSDSKHNEKKRKHCFLESRKERGNTVAKTSLAKKIERDQMKTTNNIVEGKWINHACN